MTTTLASTANTLGTYNGDAVGLCANFDPHIPLLTTYPANSRRDFLLSLGADFTHPPHNWALVWRLDELEETPESQRWPTADWPSAEAFRDAHAFIEALPDQPIPLPNLGLADDGEVNFQWKADGLHIDLGFYGTGTFSFFARGKTDEGFYGDDLPASGGLPGAILELLAG